MCGFDVMRLRLTKKSLSPTMGFRAPGLESRV